MNNMNELPESVKWRGSTYNLVKVEDGKVYWRNPVSRWEDSCSIEAWKAADPYEGSFS